MVGRVAGAVNGAEGRAVDGEGLAVGEGEDDGFVLAGGEGMWWRKVGGRGG